MLHAEMWLLEIGNIDACTDANRMVFIFVKCVGIILQYVYPQIYPGFS